MQDHEVQDQEVFDVFLAHNSEDKPQVRIIYEQLKEMGLKPWLDEKEILPGQWFQDVIQGAIRRAKSAAIFIGSHGPGRWELLELRVFIKKCVTEGIPVIPALLPTVSKIPEELSFLEQLHCVSFTDGINKSGIDRLYKSVKSLTSTKAFSLPRRDKYGIFVPVEPQSSCFLAIQARTNDPLLHAVRTAVKKSSLHIVPKNIHEVPVFHDLINDMKSSKLVIAIPDTKDDKNLDLNVNFEIGFACAIGKPLMIITKNQSLLLKSLPTHMTIDDVEKYSDKDLEFENIDNFADRISKRINSIMERLKPPFLIDPIWEGVRIACCTHRICLEPGFWENFELIIKFVEDAYKTLFPISVLVPQMLEHLRLVHKYKQKKNMQKVQMDIKKYYDNADKISYFLKNFARERLEKSLKFFLSEFESMSINNKLEYIEDSIDKLNVDITYSLKEFKDIHSKMMEHDTCVTINNTLFFIEKVSGLDVIMEDLMENIQEFAHNLREMVD